jgi:hypothetical protein
MHQGISLCVLQQEQRRRTCHAVMCGVVRMGLPGMRVPEEAMPAGFDSGVWEIPKELCQTRSSLFWDLWGGSKQMTGPTQQALSHQLLANLSMSLSVLPVHTVLE